MTRNYYCEDCDHHFKTKGKKKENNDPIFGRTWFYVAECPKCHTLVKEEKKELRGDGLNTTSTSCPTGTCPFAR